MRSLKAWFQRLQAKSICFRAVYDGFMSKIKPTILSQEAGTRLEGDNKDDDVEDRKGKK